MVTTLIRWWRIEQGSIRMAGALGFGQRVVDFEDDALGAEVAVVNCAAKH